MMNRKIPVLIFLLSFIILLGFQNCGNLGAPMNNSAPSISSSNSGGGPAPNPSPTGTLPSPTPYVLQNVWGPMAGAGTGVPSARGKMVSVWSGSQMLVFGGEFYSGGATITFFNDGAAYNSTTNVWSPIPAAPIAGRREASGVWTGTKMIYYGGYGAANTTYGDGASYDPASMMWTALPTSGAPTPRVFHSAIWTGTRMIIFGGHNYTPPVADRADGFQYDPVSNSWTAISTLGAPSARFGHSAIWTGSKMIVFGGWGGGGPRNDGGIYDPVTDTWTALPLVGAPSPRYSHMAVWTGQQMIVSGGFNSSNSGPSDFGAAYSPSTNSWIPLSASGAPTSRIDSAVWTGTKMVVFGNAGGAIYDPAANNWTPLATVGAPSARSAYGYVWTGNRMLVFGGATVGGYLGDGFYLY